METHNITYVYARLVKTTGVLPAHVDVADTRVDTSWKRIGVAIKLVCEVRAHGLYTIKLISNCDVI